MWKKCVCVGGCGCVCGWGWGWVWFFIGITFQWNYYTRFIFYLAQRVAAVTPKKNRTTSFLYVPNILSISDLSQLINTSLLTSGSETLSYADNCFIFYSVFRNIAENSKWIKRNVEKVCVCGWVWVRVWMGVGVGVCVGVCGC
jgi:hypothetical protein